MKRLAILIACALACAAPAQTTPAPTTPLPNLVPICMETTGCIVTAISNPAATLQFGGGGAAANMCQPYAASTLTLPAVVELTDNAQLCPYDPLPGTWKTLFAAQGAAGYTVSYTDTASNGATMVQTVPPVGTAATAPVPAAPSSPPAPASCGPGTGIWTWIAGGVAGQRAQLAAGATYMTGTTAAGLSPCIVAPAGGAAVDMSLNSVAVLQMAGAQTVPVTTAGGAVNTVQIAGSATPGFVISGIQFQITPAGGSTLNCAGSAPAAITCQ